MITFTGIGSAFNTTMGNTSGYIKRGHDLMLIDCGSSVFKTMNEMRLLVGLKELHVLITHTHSDHVGSLGDLILYAYYVLGIKTHIYFPHKESIQTLMTLFGALEDQYIIHEAKKEQIYDGALKGLTIEFLIADHVPNIPTYGFLIAFEGKKIYYSGDAITLPEDILKAFMEGDIMKIYQDASFNENPGHVHMSLRRLVEKIPEQHRSRVFCMHLDDRAMIEQIHKAGMNIASVSH